MADGLVAATGLAPLDLTVYFPGRLTASYLLRGRKHPFLPLSFRIIGSLQSLLSHPNVRVVFRRIHPSWPSVKPFASAASRLLVPDDPLDDAPLTRPLPDRKAEMYQEWHDDFISRPHPHPYFQSCPPPDGPRPPPFIRGALSRGNRRLFSASVQLTTGHAFTSDYSTRFRPTAGDNTLCPCSTPLRPQAHTARHVVEGCPRFTRLHRSVFRDRPPSLTHLFFTFVGGSLLAEFLWLSQDLLYPLPPPEPPP
ncbi:hypothetical protein BC826DRAFT_1113986 [Russula brevipes]|nr:hypothetical protein BC826DRAFT_1113986 [Russula brevipes]